MPIDESDLARCTRTAKSSRDKGPTSTTKNPNHHSRAEPGGRAGSELVRQLPDVHVGERLPRPLGQRELPQLAENGPGEGPGLRMGMLVEVVLGPVLGVVPAEGDQRLGVADDPVARAGAGAAALGVHLLHGPRPEPEAASPRHGGARGADLALGGRRRSAPAPGAPAQALPSVRHGRQLLGPRPPDIRTHDPDPRHRLTDEAGLPTALYSAM